jgi:uncharacterized MnhB-related membrane protein
MSALLQVILLVLVGATAFLVVAERQVERQMLVLSLYGLLLTLLFVTLQAPDVALSELTVGGAALPLMLAAAQARVMEDKS